MATGSARRMGIGGIDLVVLSDNLENRFDEFVTVEGGGVETELNRDGSVTAVEARLIPVLEEHQALRLSTVTFTISNEAMQVGTFFGLPELENGLLIQLKNEADEVVHDFTGGRPITLTRHFGWLVGDNKDFFDQPGNQVDEMILEWELDKAGSAPVLTDGIRLAITIQDDLTELNSAEIFCQGMLVTGW